MNIRKVRYYLKYFRAYFPRNEYTIGHKRAIKNEVNIEHSSNRNIGDTLGPVVAEYLLGLKGIDLHKKVKKTKHMLSIGSIIGRGKCDMTIWGSGFLVTKNIKSVPRKKLFLGMKFDVRAVRGPMTRKELIKVGVDCPEIYGDPAIFMPDIYTPSSVEKKYPVSLILHHRTVASKDNVLDKKNYIIPVPEDLHMINPATDDYRAFADELLASEKIISSSLHGIILAEAYGVPTVFLNWGMGEQQLKFKDWYLSTGRKMCFANTLEEALVMEPMPLPDLKDLKEGLVKAFPYDLWED